MFGRRPTIDTENADYKFNIHIYDNKVTLLMNSYYNGLITNEEVIKELLKAAEEIADLRKQGEKLGLSEEELAFYDALTKPEKILKL